MKIYSLKPLVLISLVSFSSTNLAANQADVAKMVQRIENLEQQVKILEDSLPKRIRKLPLDLPHLSSNGALQESMSRIEDMFNINFIQYHQQITQNRKYCSEKAFRQYTQFLQKTNWVEDLKQTKSLLYVTPKARPKIIKEGAQKNTYTWVMSVPLEIYLENNSGKKQHPLKVTMTVQRASELAHPSGMLISDIRFEQN